MSDGLRAILDGRRGDVTAAEFEEWRALTLATMEACKTLVRLCPSDEGLGGLAPIGAFYLAAEKAKAALAKAS